MFQAGAGICEIVIPREYAEVENFGQIHDPLHARAVILKEKESFAVISLEVTSLMGDAVQEMKKAASAATGISEQNIWICATHSFSSPHLLPDHMLKTPERIALREKFRNNLVQAVSEASKMASEHLQDASIRIGTGRCDIVGNRDIELPEGWWIGAGGDGPTDRTVTTIAVDDSEGNPIAVVAHYAMQSSVMDQSVLSDGKKPITSDLAGLACAKAEEVYGGVVLYLIGAAGDQAPVEKAVLDIFRNGARVRTDLKEKGFEICGRLSTELAEAIVKTAKEAKEEENPVLRMEKARILVPAQKMKGDVHSLVPTRSYEFEQDGEKEMEIEAFRIGSAALLGVKPELNFVTGNEIRSGSEFDHTLVCTMVNGAAKYMADQGSFERFCYESMNSPWDKNGAEHLAEEGIRLLNSLNQSCR